MQNADAPPPESEQNEAERAAAFLAAPRSKFDLPVFGSTLSPRLRNAIFVVAVTLLVLGLVGGFAEAFVGNVGVAGNFAQVPTTLTSTPVPTTGQMTSKRSLLAFMGMKKIAPTPADDFSLADQHNRAWSLRSSRGKVVVITFYSVDCQDICPVLGREIKQADSILGADASHVAFVIVNTDPDETAILANPPALTIPSLSTVHSAHFLNGPLAALNRVWSNYGVTIDVRSRLNMHHNNVMFFVTPKGRLAEIAIPFGNENRRGHFSLKLSDIRRFAQGIALMASSLIK